MWLDILAQLVKGSMPEIAHILYLAMQPVSAVIRLNEGFLGSYQISIW